MSNETELTPVFMPALSTLLIAAEDKKGAPLDKAEALNVRDSAVCIMMQQAEVAKMADSRGCLDIDPENCWYDWQMLRRELGRKPDLDAGARVDYFSNEDAEYQLTIEQARKTLGQFRSMFDKFEPWSPLIKTELSKPNSDGRCFVWLNNVRQTNDGFVAQVFEIPPTLQGFAIGDQIEVATTDVLDWMINDNGTLHGGFSIRYHRGKMPEHERDAFDQHLGVSTYA